MVLLVVGLGFMACPRVCPLFEPLGVRNQPREQRCPRHRPSASLFGFVECVVRTWGDGRQPAASHSRVRLYGLSARFSAWGGIDTASARSQSDECTQFISILSYHVEPNLE